MITYPLTLYIIDLSETSAANVRLLNTFHLHSCLQASAKIFHLSDATVTFHKGHLFILYVINFSIIKSLSDATLSF